MAGQNGLFEQVLPSLDADPPVVELDDINDRPNVCLPERYRPCAQVLTHHATKSLDCGGIDVYLGCELLFGALQRSLRPIMVGLERVQPISEYAIQVCDPFFYKSVEAFQLLFRVVTSRCNAITRPLRLSDFAARREAREDKISVRRSGRNNRSIK